MIIRNERRFSMISKLRIIYTVPLFIALMLAMMILSSCSGQWLGGGEEDAPLPGERISIVNFQKDLEVSGDVDVASLSLPTPWENKYWPGADGYPNHVMSNLALGQKDTDLIQKLWSKDIGAEGSDSLPLIARPIIVKDAVYAIDAVGRLTKMNIDDGRVIWSVAVTPKDEDDGVIGGGVAFGDGKLFVTAGFNEVLAIDPENGGLFWRYKSSAPLRATPTALDGRVYVQDVQSEFFALNVMDGALLWRHAGLNEKTGVVGAAVAAIDRDMIVVPYPSGEIYGLRAENGGLLWTVNLSPMSGMFGARRGSGIQSAIAGMSDIVASPVIENGVVYAMNFSGALVAIEGRSGSQLWRQDIGGRSTPLVVGDFIFALSDDAKLYGLEKASGKIIWVSQLPRFENEENRYNPILISGPVMGNGILYLTNSDGYLMRVDPKTGDMLAAVKTSNDVLMPPVIANQTLFVLGNDANLVAYR